MRGARQRWMVVTLLPVGLLAIGLTGCRLQFATAMSTGSDGNHNCAIVGADAHVECWGSNNWGETGTGPGSSSSPRPVVGIVGAVHLVIGLGRTCAVIDDGSVSCWGLSQAPAPVAGLADVVALGLGGGVGDPWACALLGDATVVCWGSNAQGQLGDGTTTDRSTPAPVTGMTDVTAISTGRRTGCATRIDGTVWCWGSFDNGARGGGADGTFAPLVVPGITGATTIRSGPFMSCVVADPDQSVTCWGTSMGALHFLLPESDGTIDLVVGNDRGCLLGSDGQVRCAGFDSPLLGIAGLPRDTAILHDPVFNLPWQIVLPTAVPGRDDVVDLGGGGTEYCAVEAGGDVHCWGDIGVARPKGTPDPLTNVTKAADGCAVLQGLVRCRNAPRHQGTFAYDSGDGYGLVRDTGGGPLEAIAVAGFGGAGCAIRPDATAACWGANDRGQVGDGTTVRRDEAVTVPGIGGVTSLVPGSKAMCALAAGGAVWCWGDNAGGILGTDPALTPMSATPLQIAGLPGPASVVAVGTGYGCALVPTASVFTATIQCWGTNGQGQFGNGTTTSSFAPVPSTMIRPVGLSVGGATTCGLRNDGFVQCWGDATTGKLGGYSGLPFRSSPVGVTTGALDVLRVNVQDTCVRKADGVWCWTTSPIARVTDIVGVPIARELGPFSMVLDGEVHRFATTSPDPVGNLGVSDSVLEVE